MKRSLFTGFLFLPLGISVHIYVLGQVEGSACDERNSPL